MSDASTLPQRRRAFGVALGIALPALIFLPPLFFYAGLSSSLALGTSLACLVLLLSAIAALRGLRLSWSRWAIVGLAAVTAHGIVAMLFQPFDSNRAVLSLGPLVLLATAGCALAEVFASASRTAADRVIGACLTLLFAASLASILGISLGEPASDRLYDKPVFPFTEPSHFALVFTPLLMHRCVSTTGYRRGLALLLGVAVAAWLQNLTLIVGMLMIGCVCLRGFLLPIAATLVALLAAASDLSYYLERLDFSGDVQNLSNLVYVQGWQLIGESLDRSSGWGLGFQQLGLHGGSTAAGDLILALLGVNSNLLDGGFTLSKLVSEFGVWGIALTTLYLLAAGSSFLFLRSVARSPRSVAAYTILARSVIATYSIELFIRGAGYFTGTGVLLITSLVVVYGPCRARSRLRYSTRRSRLAATGLQPLPRPGAT